MSYGLVICSSCHYEVHQDGDKNVEKGWRHCATKTPRCAGASSIYPSTREEIIGDFCGVDDLDHRFTQPRRRK